MRMKISTQVYLMRMSEKLFTFCILFFAHLLRMKISTILHLLRMKISTQAYLLRMKSSTQAHLIRSLFRRSQTNTLTRSKHANFQPPDFNIHEIWGGIAEVSKCGPYLHSAIDMVRGSDVPHQYSNLVEAMKPTVKMLSLAVL